MKDAVGIPVLSVGRYHDPALAERVLADGHADFISIARATLADPDLPRKAAEGRPQDIRPCVACEQGCIDRWVSALDITCVGNPESGRELLPGWQTPQPTGEPRRVLVVGGGAAGLEAARVAAVEGHEVTLWERVPRWAARPRSPPRRPRANWPAPRVARRTGARARRRARDRSSRHRRGRARPRRGRRRPGDRRAAVAAAPCPGLGSNVTDPMSVLRGDVRGGPEVVVYGGDLIGCQTALFLASEGHEVTLVAHGKSALFDDGMDEFANDMVGTIVRPLLLERLKAAVTLMPKRGVKRVLADSVVIDSAGAFNPHPSVLRTGPVDEELLPLDTVVLGVRRRPNDELYEQLDGRVSELYLVGDAVDPRTVEEAVAEGSAAARSVGGPLVTSVGEVDPAVPVLA